MSSAKAVSFLAKKSWHVGTMQHKEKVWIAERSAKQEMMKAEELKRELEEEREIESLKRNHETLTGVKKKERVEFLYRQPIAAGPSEEDYLLGARWKAPKEENDLNKLKGKPGSLWLDSPRNMRLDKMAKIKDDPLFAIKKEEQNKIQRLKDNPIQMGTIRKNAEEKQKKKDLKKRIKKLAKKRMEDPSYKVERPQEKKPQVKRSQSDQDTEYRRESKYYEKQFEERNRDKYRNNRERSRSRESYRDRERMRSHERQRNRDGKQDRSYQRRDSPDRRDYSKRKREDEPDLNNVRKKRRVESEKTNEQLLQEMEQRALLYHDKRKEQIQKYSNEEAKERAEEQAKAHKDKDDPVTFITKVSQTVYQDGSSTASLSDRLKRNAYNIQRRNLDEKGIY
jgi:hypothetical protein